MKARARRIPTALLATAANAIVYLAANHFPRVPPILLRLTPLDRAIPFWPSAVWLYASDYLLLLMSLLVIVDEKKAIRFLEAYFCASLLAACVQWAWPVRFPRELFPVEGLAGVTGWALRTYRVVDTASGCIPSMHVAGAAIAVSFCWEERAFIRVTSAIWAVLIVASTLVAKQHYVIDLLTGVVLWLLVVGVVRPHANMKRPSAALGAT